jgi:hypothetical protein
MSAQTEHWSGPQGDQYTARNRVDWRKRVPFWGKMLDLTAARSIFELGCNSGFNLTAAKAASGIHDVVRTHGCDINRQAALQSSLAGHKTWCGSSAVHMAGESFPCFDLVFTCGVLIHIPPAALSATMDELIAVSAQYVLCMEYHADQEEMVEYRGVTDRLWRRPYAKLYEQKGLKQVFSGVLNEPGVWDDLTWALFSK